MIRPCLGFALERLKTRTGHGFIESGQRQPISRGRILDQELAPWKGNGGGGLRFGPRPFFAEFIETLLFGETNVGCGAPALSPALKLTKIIMPGLLPAGGPICERFWLAGDPRRRRSGVPLRGGVKPPIGKVFSE